MVRMCFLIEEVEKMGEEVGEEGKEEEDAEFSGNEMKALMGKDRKLNGLNLIHSMQSCPKLNGASARLIPMPRSHSTTVVVAVVLPKPTREVSTVNSQRCDPTHSSPPCPRSTSARADR